MFSAPSRCLSLPVVRCPSPFLAAGPRFGMTHAAKVKIWLIVVSLFLLRFYSSQSFKYNNRWTRAGRDGEERIGMGPTRAATETRNGTGGQERPTDTSSIVFNSFYSPSRSSSFQLPLILQSTPTGGVGWSVSVAGGTTHRSYPPREVGGATGMYSVIFVRCSHLLFFSLFLFSVVSFLRRLSTGGLGRGRTVLEP